MRGPGTQPVPDDGIVAPDAPSALVLGAQTQGSVRGLARWAAGVLAEREGLTDSPDLDAEVLLRHVLGLDRTAYFVAAQDAVALETALRYADLLGRRLGGEPVAYLTGVREFFGLPFLVTPDVLVPRPETESLVQWALDRARRHVPVTILDIGTGSGAIALSVAARQPPDRTTRVIGSDLSGEALAVARRNQVALATNGAVSAVRFVRGDLAGWCRGPVDLLLANLPYLTTEQRMGNPELAAEPALALVSGPDGLVAIDRLVSDLPRALSPSGAAILELDPAQAEGVHYRIGLVMPSATVSILEDLAGTARFVTVER